MQCTPDCLAVAHCCARAAEDVNGIDGGGGWRWQTVTDVHPRAGTIAGEYLFLSERNGSISIRDPKNGLEVSTHASHAASNSTRG